MTDATRPPFNPTWITAIAVVLTGVISGSVNTALNSRDAQDFREFRAAQLKWNDAMERRVSDDQLATSKVLVGLTKDVERANDALKSIQQALMVRPSATASNTP